MLDLLIKHATIVTMNSENLIIEDGMIGITDSHISFIESSADASHKAEPIEASKVIDADGCAVFPGLINMHTHSYQSLIKGIESDRPLNEWLDAAALPAASALDADTAYAGALITAIENVHSGVTTVVDMYPRIDLPIFDAVIEGYAKIGITPIFAAGFMHSDEESDVQELERRLKNLIVYAASRNKTSDIPLMLAPFQVWNNSAASLYMTQELSNEYGLRVTIHAKETEFDHLSTLNRHNLSELAALHQHSLLNTNTSIVHGVTCTNDEIQLIADMNASVCYSPICNMYLGSGYAPIPKMITSGVNVCLGTEGAGCNNTNNMLETIKIAVLSQKALNHDPSVLNALDAIRMATINGARALGRDSKIGSLEVGKDADLFIFDPFASSTATPMHNAPSSLVYSSSPTNITTVISKGNILMEGGHIRGIDEYDVLHSCGQSAQALINKAGIKR